MSDEDPLSGEAEMRVCMYKHSSCTSHSSWTVYGYIYTV
jgi:hypothetical protein